MAQMFDFQLDLFETLEEREMRYRIERIEKSTDRVRKGTYARINGIEKRILDVDERLALLERHICRMND